MTLLETEWRQAGIGESVLRPKEDPADDDRFYWVDAASITDRTSNYARPATDFPGPFDPPPETDWLRARNFDFTADGIPGDAIIRGIGMRMIRRGWTLREYPEPEYVNVAPIIDEHICLIIDDAGQIVQTGDNIVFARQEVAFNNQFLAEGTLPWHHNIFTRYGGPYNLWGTNGELTASAVTHPHFGCDISEAASWYWLTTLMELYGWFLEIYSVEMKIWYSLPTVAGYHMII